MSKHDFIFEHSKRQIRINFICQAHWYTCGLWYLTVPKEEEEATRKKIEIEQQEYSKTNPGLIALHPLLHGMPHSVFHWIP